MKSYILLFISTCISATVQQLGYLEHTFNGIRTKMDFTNPEELFPDILVLNKEIGDVLDEGYGEIMAQLSCHHSIDFIGLFFWNFTKVSDLKEEDIRWVFLNVNESIALGKFTYYKLTSYMVSKGIDKVSKDDSFQDRDNIIFHLKTILNRFAEELCQLQELYPKNLKLK